jgi:hypothetical protein
MDNQKKRKLEEDDEEYSAEENEDQTACKNERITNLIDQMSIIKKQIDEMENIVNKMNEFYIKQISS